MQTNSEIVCLLANRCYTAVSIIKMFRKRKKTIDIFFFLNSNILCFIFQNIIDFAVLTFVDIEQDKNDYRLYVLIKHETR